MASFTTRQGDRDDLGRVAEIRTLGWQHGYRGILPDEYLDELDVAAEAERWREFSRRFDDLGEHLEVAERDGTIAGYVLIGPFRSDADADADDEADAAPDFGEVMALYVDPAWWGSGAADALLTAATDLLRERGHQRAGLWVFEANARARRFYERHGWSFDGTRDTAAHFGVAAPHIRYVVDLT